MIRKNVLLFLLASCLSPSFYLTANPHSLYLEAQQLLSKTQYAKAEYTIRKSLEIEPQFPDAWFLLSRIQFRLGQQRAAIQSYKTGVEKKRLIQEHTSFLKNDLFAADKSGVDSIAYQALHQINEARKAYFQGKLESRRGLWYEAVVYFEKACQLDPENLLYRNALGNALLDSGDYYSAEDIFRQSLQIDPYQKEIYFKLMTAADEKRIFHQAMHWVLEGRKFFPSETELKDRELYYDYIIRQDKKHRE